MKILVVLIFLCGNAVGRRWYSSCPKDKPMVYCLINPCRFSNCPAYPQATCRSNYCGGCHAEWYLKNRRVKCETSSPCPNGEPLVKCFADPCTVNTCPAHPHAECRSNYCGGCNADFYVNNQKVDCEISPPCPNDQIVNCFVDPCRFASCPGHPDAKCISNYCGGCNAVWYEDGNEIVC